MTNNKMAAELNGRQTKAKKTFVPQQIKRLHENSKDYWMMQTYMEKMFQFIPDNEQLLNRKFMLLHINCHAHDGEQFYFPAEISALEFSLLNGVTRVYHKLIGISKIYPKGFAGGMREYSDKFHQISCWDEHSDNYNEILLDFLSFLKDGKVFSSDLVEGKLDLPYMFTIETESGSNMMNVKSSLETLYTTVFPEHTSDRYKLLFKIGSLERLFNEILKKFNIHLDERYIRSGMTIHDILESDMYGHGLGCMYHELREIAYKCSKSRILQWMSNMCKHIHEYTGLELIPGKHLAVLLRDGSRMIIENEDVPLTRNDLKMKSLTEYIDYQEDF